ncbi:hypothetical protein AGLY_006659 [Aphis glycines]|uniref:Transmembrane protein n=1 Tax=Aphis glycines TaxID=307491 RepID=A0A6G0TS64_APHGL|nr:hypothetical protein AGLY_006659 [Aphis glycines]
MNLRKDTCAKLTHYLKLDFLDYLSNVGKKRRQVDTTLLYIRGWGGPRTGVEKFMENLIPNFQNLVIKEKIFTIFQPQNYLQIFAILTYFIFWSAKKFLSLFQKKYSEKLKISIFLSYSKIKNSILTKTGFAGAEVKNRSIFTAPNVVHRHKKKKTHIIFMMTRKKRFSVDVHLEFKIKTKYVNSNKDDGMFSAKN